MKDLFFYIKKNKALVFTVALLFLTVFIQTSYIKKLRVTIADTQNARYQKAFFDLSSSLSNIDLSLKKALVTNDTRYLNYTAGEIKKEAGILRECIGDLPIKDVDLINSNRFLYQLSDYMISLARKNTEPDYNDRQALKQFSSYADILSREILDTENKFLTDELDFSSIVSAKADDMKANSFFESIEKKFSNYPDFIYDGKYSDNISDNEDKNGEPEISKETAKKKALEFLSLKDLSESSDSALGTEVYGFQKDDRIFIDVTKKGGYILSFLDSREITEEKITVDTAIKKAEKFLKTKGFEGFSADFYEKENSTLTISFFKAENGITVYPEEIKLKVALDNGDITGADFGKYLKNKKERTSLIPQITPEEAKMSINKNAEIKSERLCIIPLYRGKEILAYEFHITSDKRDYLYYINAQTGTTEKILMIIKDKNKILAI